ncbi:MAG TPA: TonB-dependent receptor plug domain-containing protein [Polyangiaceae bacterium]
MTRPRISRSAAFVLAGLAASSPSPARADPPVTPVAPAAAATNALAATEEVEVTGARTPAPDRTGASVTVLTRKNLESLPGGDTQPLSYALATQPGIVNDTFGFGVHTRGADGNVAYVIDGIPLLTVPLGQYGVGNFVPRRLIQSLSLTTGGFPAEYGYGLGAVVDIETRKALGPPAGEVRLAYGTYQFFEPSFDFSQQAGKLGYFVAGSFQTTSRGLDPPSVTPILHDDMKAGSAFARVDYEVGARDRLELIAVYDQHDYQIPIDPTVLPLADAPPGAVRGVDVYGNPPPPFVPYGANPTDDERDFFVALSYVHRIRDDATVQIAPYAHAIHGSLLCDPAGSLGPTADPGSTCSDVTRDIVHGGLSTTFAWKAGPSQTWKAGAMVDVAESKVDYVSYQRDDGSPLGGADPAGTLSGSDRTNVLVAGAFVQDRITLGNWTILPGARADVQHASFLRTGVPDLVLGGPSGRLGVSYAFTDDLVVHAYGGYVVQLPSAIDAPVAARILVPSLAGQPIPVDLKAERDWMSEIGFSDRIAQRATLTLTGWGRLVTDQLDRQNVGTTDLVASYNFSRGRAVGAEIAAVVSPSRILDGFANGGWQIAQGQGFASERYLFTPAELASTGWGTLDHVQTWTSNVGFDLHDARASSHLSGLINYGSGLRTGATDQLSVPPHVTLDVTLRHRFDVPLHPEVALDVLNAFDDVYAIRIATGYVGSAYAPLRRVMLRLAVPFPG